MPYVYYFLQRHLDKGGDLLEEASQASVNSGSGLRDLARSLKNHLRGFSDRLEDTRERLEDTSRCFYLLDKVSYKLPYHSVDIGPIVVYFVRTDTKKQGFWIKRRHI